MKQGTDPEPPTTPPNAQVRRPATRLRRNEVEALRGRAITIPVEGANPGRPARHVCQASGEGRATRRSTSCAAHTPVLAVEDGGSEAVHE